MGVHAETTGRQHFVPAVAVGVPRQESVHGTEILHRDRLARPLARTVVDERRREPVWIGLALGIAIEDRRHDEHGLAVAADIRPANAVRGRNRIDPVQRPGLGRIAGMAQNRDISGAARADRAEAVGERNLGDAVTVEVGRVDVDHPRQVAGEHVAFPGRILEPEKLRHPGAETDEIDPAVTIEIGDHGLITETKPGSGRMRDELRPGQRRQDGPHEQNRASDKRTHCSTPRRTRMLAAQAAAPTARQPERYELAPR